MAPIAQTRDKIINSFNYIKTHSKKDFTLGFSILTMINGILTAKLCNHFMRLKVIGLKKPLV